MKTIILLYCILLAPAIVLTQTLDDIQVNVRGLKDYRISKRDSILISEIKFMIESKDMEINNKIPFLLNDCSLSKKTKKEIINSIISNSDYLDSLLFPVMSEIIFFRYIERELSSLDVHQKQLKSRYYFLEQIVNKRNVVDFCNYVIEKDKLNKCVLYNEDCYFPTDDVGVFTQTELFLSIFAEMCSLQQIKHIDAKIENSSNNDCLHYNLLRIRNILFSKIKNNDK